LELAGAAPLPDSDALSLLPLLRGQTNRHRDFVESALNDWRMVFDGRFKTVDIQGKPSLRYDLHEDPLEMNGNLPVT
jgi:hypothetical protein